MSDTIDLEDKRQGFEDKYRRYLKSLSGFQKVQQHFEGENPRISQLDWKDRMEYVFENYEKHLDGLRKRPEGLKMRILPNGINEFQTFCDALRIGWKLLPDWWSAFQMFIDYLSQDTLTEDLEGLDFSTLTVLKEIAKCEIWRNNEFWGPRATSPQAKCILIRYERKCSFTSATASPLMFSMNPLDNITSLRICDDVNCFKVETYTVKFKKCGNCGKMYYCSKNCQKSSWKGGHKKECHS